MKYNISDPFSVIPSSLITDSDVSKNYRDANADGVYSGPDYDGLVLSIKANGQLMPCYVWRDPDDKLHLVAGFRRYHAVMALHRELLVVEIKVAKSRLAAAVATLRAIENARLAVTFPDRVRSIQELTAAGVKMGGIAAAWGVSQEYVKMVLGILSAAEEKALPEGWHSTYSFDSASELMKQPDVVAAHNYYIEKGRLPPREKGTSGRGRPVAHAAPVKALGMLASPLQSFPWDSVPPRKPDQYYRVLRWAAANGLCSPEDLKKGEETLAAVKAAGKAAGKESVASGGSSDATTAKDPDATTPEGMAAISDESTADDEWDDDADESAAEAELAVDMQRALAGDGEKSYDVPIPETGAATTFPEPDLGFGNY